MADFPGAFWTPPTRGTNMSDAVTQTDILDQQNDEIVAIEGALGLNPQGGHSTVASRLNFLETRPGCKLIRPAVAIGSGASVTTVAFNSISYEVYDIGDFRPSAGSFVTIPAGRAGDYLVTVQARWAANSGGYRLVRALIGGTTFSGEATLIEDFMAPGAPVACSVSASDVVRLPAGATVQLGVAQTSGSTLDVTVGLSVTMLRTVSGI